MASEQWSGFFAQRKNNLAQRIGRHALRRRYRYANRLRQGTAVPAVDQRTTAAIWIKIQSGSRYRAISNLEQSRGRSREYRMTDMDPAKRRTKNPEVAPGVDDAGRDSGFSKRLDRAIDGETFGDSAQIDDDAPPEKDLIIFPEKNVAPGGGRIEMITAFRQIIPIG